MARSGCPASTGEHATSAGWPAEGRREDTAGGEIGGRLQLVLLAQLQISNVAINMRMGRREPFLGVAATKVGTGKHWAVSVCT